MLRERKKPVCDEFFPDGEAVVQALEAYLEDDFLALQEKVDQYIVEGQVQTALSLIFFAAAIVDYLYKHYFYQGVNPGFLDYFMRVVDVASLSIGGFLAGHGQISFAEAHQLEKRLGIKQRPSKGGADRASAVQYDTIALWRKLQSLHIYTLN